MTTLTIIKEETTTTLLPVYNWIKKNYRLETTTTLTIIKEETNNN